MRTMALVKVILAFVAASGISGCQSLGLIPSSPTAMMDPQDAKDFRAATDTVLLTFADDGEATELPNAEGDPRWHAVTMNGFVYVDKVCFAYIDDLYHAKKGYDAAQGTVSAAETAANAILSATLGKADVQKTIQVLTGLFGLSKGLLSVSEKSVLYQLDPSTVIDLWSKLANTYKTSYAALPYPEAETDPAKIKYGTFGRKAYTRAEALGHISQYLSLCLPPRLESSVLAAVRAAKVTDTANPPDCSKDENKEKPECKKTPPTDCSKPENAKTNECKAKARAEFCAKPENENRVECLAPASPAGPVSPPARTATSPSAMPMPAVVP